METKHPQWFGLLASDTSNTSDTSDASIGSHAGDALPRRTKRNLWIVVGFFGLVIAAWINSQV